MHAHWARWSTEWQWWFSAVSRFATIRSQPSVDPSQDIADTVASFQNGFTTINFTRPRNSGDTNDISLDQCRFLLYAYGSSAIVATSTIVYHQNNRGLLTERFCLPSAKDCPAPTTAVPGVWKLQYITSVAKLHGWLQWGQGLGMHDNCRACISYQIEGAQFSCSAL